MKTNAFYTGAALMLLAAMLSSCGTPSNIKQVADKPVADLKADDNTKPIQLTKVVVKLKRGEHIGALKAGLLCVPHGNLNWKGGRVNVDSEEFTEAFKEELEKFSFKTVGDVNALFEDPSTWKSEILVAGLVKELKANICYPMAGFGDFNSSKAEVFIKVDWQIYSKLDRSVVHSVTTEGSFNNKESAAGGDTVAILNAFAQASRNLLADEKFREIVSKGGQTVRETVVKSAGTIVLAAKNSKPVGTTPADWTNAVVTVFAGRGHGSGFAISDDLIITNEHVVSEANSVTVKFQGGLQVIGKVIASNTGRDVALVKLDAAMPKYFRVERSLPAVGTEVYAIGTPLDENLESTMSRGIVSGIRNHMENRLIQSDVNIRPGNSGGPLVGKDGKVVGITVSTLVVGDVPAGINFFIPIDDALKSLGAI